MKELKFRVWWPGVKEMRYFDHPVLIMDGENRYGIFIPSIEGSVFMGKSSDPMQYTGLTDKNGKEIYEGDILKYDDPMWNFKPGQIHIGAVRWQDWNGAFDCERRIIDGKEVKPEHGLPGIQFKWRSEVIGNIYENPELLGGNNAGC